jgi:prepilin-type processing-associated H-X9-DG protein
VSWDDMITKYLGARLSDSELVGPSTVSRIGTLVCPSDETARPTWARQPRSYAVNRNYHATQNYPGTQEKNWGAFSGFHTTPGSPYPAGAIWPRTYKLTEFPRSSETIMAMDSPTFNNVLGNESGGYIDNPTSQYNGFVDLKSGPHNKKGNYLFVDGHVASHYVMETVGEITSGTPSYGWPVNPRGMWKRFRQ